MLRDRPPALVSLMLANNETGALQPVKEASEIVHAAGGVLHVDAIQAFGKISFGINTMGIDLITLSAHKIGVPRASAPWFWQRGCWGLSRCCAGGGQELGRRAGTENVAGITGFGAAVQAAMVGLDSGTIQLENLQNRLEKGLRGTPEMIIFADSVPRLPNTTLFTVPGLKAETAVIGFDLAGVAVSSGSACSSGKVQPLACAGSDGIRPGIGPGSGAAQSGLVHVGSGRRSLP
ncbi:MAG: aminotransferase class V-fold PLP-dependent enzyme [Bradyrhizobium sp.]